MPYCVYSSLVTPASKLCLLWFKYIFYKADLAIFSNLQICDPPISASWILELQHDCRAGLHLPLSQYVARLALNLKQSSCFCLSNTGVTSICHCAWLLGLILESGPVTLSVSCPLPIEINIIRTADPRTIVRKPLLLFCLPSTSLRSNPHPSATSSSVPEPREPLGFLYPACGFTLQQTKLGPWASREAACLLSRAQLSTIRAPSPHQGLELVHPISRATVFSPGQDRDNTQPHENFCVLMDLSHKRK